MTGTYRIYNFNVTQFMRPGQRNALAVEVFTPTPTDLGMNWLDWSPMPPDTDMGLWSSVYLETSGSVALRHLMVSTHFPNASLAQANLTVFAQATNATSQAVNAVVRGTIEGIQFQQNVRLQPGQSRTITFAPDAFPQLRVAHPKIWWPYARGPQNLGTLAMSVSVDGKISDRQNVRFGIRDITSALDAHHYIHFRVNGRPILIRGGGCAPDMLLRRSPRKLEAEFDYVRELGLNTIRLEGKVNVSNAFLNFADRRGGLVLLQLLGTLEAVEAERLGHCYGAIAITSLMASQPSQYPRLAQWQR